MRKPNRRTIRDTVRASVPDGKLRGAKIKLASIGQNQTPLGGLTTYDAKSKRVTMIGAPDGNDAFSITVRGHETGHATLHKPARKKPMTELSARAEQAVDDVLVENGRTIPKGLSVQSEREYRRAHMAVAMKDISNVASITRQTRGTKHDSHEVRNANLLNSVRTLAMLKRYSDNHDVRLLRSKYRGLKSLQSSIGGASILAINEVIKLASMARGRNRAVSMLLALMESAPPEDNPEFPAGGEEDEDSEILNPVTHGEASEGHMQINDLRPKSVYTSKDKTIRLRKTSDGVILNPERFVNAIVSNDANGLFSRRIRDKAGGTVVIDASGSMGATKENLSALCALVPTATIAYYSGSSEGKGILSVYAEKGKRFNGELPQNTLLGGNAVDLPALRWLLQHDKPWTLVSDLAFCSGVEGSETIALALVERLEQRGELVVHRTLDSAYEAFGGKVDLADAEAKRERRERKKARHDARITSQLVEL